MSARTSEEDIIRALERGADDYLTKPFSVKLLEIKVKVALRRSTMGDTSKVNNMSSGGVNVDLDGHRVRCDEAEIQLTQKEFDLLALLIRKPGKVFTRNQLLNIIWGYENDVNSRTVDVHMAMLRKKLSEKGRHIRTLPKIGYVWEAKLNEGK
jgi:DNA-binding response OmpR family regulator